MSAQTYRQLIVEGIRDLPAETLAEIEVRVTEEEKAKLTVQTILYRIGQ
jgi:hypothetical protein